MKVIAFAGSIREGSWNRKLLQLAVRAVEKAGAEVTVIDLRDYPMPIYDGDRESSEGLPDTALKLQALFKQHSGLLLASPEYNSGYSPLLKNTLDWVSRASSEGPSLAAFKGKSAMLMAASPSGFGGLRGLLQLQTVLLYMGVTVLPGQTMISSATSAFDGEGEFTDPGNTAKLDKQAESFLRLLQPPPSH